MINTMKHYYLINNTIKKGSDMPQKPCYKVLWDAEGDEIWNDWLNSLQPCEIDDSELDNVKKHILSTKLRWDEIIDITDLLFDYGCYHDGVWRERLKFKQPTEKQVESEYEAVEFYKWTATLTPTSNENCFNKIRDGYYRIKPPMELYEIFKNR